MKLTITLLGHELKQTGVQHSRRGKLATCEVQCERCCKLYRGMGFVLDWCKGAK